MYYEEEKGIFVRYGKSLKKRLANEVITFIDC